jgi:hypothetical protein
MPPFRLPQPPQRGHLAPTGLRSRLPHPRRSSRLAPPAAPPALLRHNLPDLRSESRGSPPPRRQGVLFRRAGHLGFLSQLLRQLRRQLRLRVFRRRPIRRRPEEPSRPLSPDPAHGSASRRLPAQSDRLGSSRRNRHLRSRAGLSPIAPVPRRIGHCLLVRRGLARSRSCTSRRQRTYLPTFRDWSTVDRRAPAQAPGTSRAIGDSSFLGIDRVWDVVRMLEDRPGSGPSCSSVGSCSLRWCPVSSPSPRPSDQRCVT